RENARTRIEAAAGARIHRARAWFEVVSPLAPRPIIWIARSGSCGCNSASLLPAFDEEAFQQAVKHRERKPLMRWRFALVIAVLYFAVIALTPLPDRLVLFPTTDR